MTDKIQSILQTKAKVCDRQNSKSVKDKVQGMWQTKAKVCDRQNSKSMTNKSCTWYEPCICVWYEFYIF